MRRCLQRPPRKVAIVTTSDRLQVLILRRMATAIEQGDVASLGFACSNDPATGGQTFVLRVATEPGVELLSNPELVRMMRR